MCNRVALMHQITSGIHSIQPYKGASLHACQTLAHLMSIIVTLSPQKRNRRIQ